MISLHRSMHSSQMYTPGPAMSFFTCFCDLPQNEHFNNSPVSPNFATMPPLVRSADGTGAVDSCAGRDHLIDNAILHGLRSLYNEVPVGVGMDLLDRLAGVVGKDLLEQVAHAQDL